MKLPALTNSPTAMIADVVNIPLASLQIAYGFERGKFNCLFISYSVSVSYG